MLNNDITKALQILEKFEFFGGQRAGRELWNDKPVDVQNKDIEDFVKDIAFLKNLINRLEAKIDDMYDTLNYRADKILELEDNLKTAQAENERLENAYKQCAFERDAYIEIENTSITEAKAEAYKEFAERLKKEMYTVGFDIDNLLKEMIGV